MRRDAVLALGLAVVAAGATGTLTWLTHTWLPAGRSLPGSYVGGKIQPADASLGDWLQARRADLARRQAWVATPREFVPVTFGELGIELDVAATMSEAVQNAQRGTLGARLYRAWRARQGEVDVPLVFAVDENRARAKLEDLAPGVWVDPVDARLDLRGHRRIDDVEGTALDVDATLAEVIEGERGQDAVFGAATKPVRANVTTAMLADVDVSSVLAAYETSFGGTGRGRAKNIARAAELLNETIVAPQQVVSFNQLVGARTLERGFTWAPVIVRDEMEPGVGGGCCQVASTLHAAAVYGLLEVVERRSHSRPSGYAPLGLDATVVYGEVDLKVKNPYDTPIIVHAFLPKPTVLRIELLGRSLPSKVEYQYVVTKTEDFFRRVTTKAWLEAEKRIRRQKGIRGYGVVSLVRTKHSDGKTRERRYFSGYKPVPEVFWVGPGHDLTTLPDLPKGAERVEFDLLDPPAEVAESGI